MATKMKKYKMDGPGDKVTGSEQGKGSKIGRVLGIVGPSIGAAALAIKANLDKNKEKREKKKLEKDAADREEKKNLLNGKTTNKPEPPGDPKLIKKSTGGATKKMYKTGGMVNSNPKLFADKIPGSKGVKSGVNPKVNKQTKPKGKVGGTSTAPKKAKPGKS